MSKILMGYRASHKLYAGATTDVILKALGEMVDQYNKWFADRKNEDVKKGRGTVEYPNIYLNITDVEDAKTTLTHKEINFAVNYPDDSKSGEADKIVLES